MLCGRLACRDTYYLNNLAAFLSEAGERGEALEAAREAVRLRRSLVEESPVAYTPDLAMSLNTLAIRLSEAGERGEALEAAQKAANLLSFIAFSWPASPIF